MNQRPLRTGRRALLAFAVAAALAGPAAGQSDVAPRQADAAGMSLEPGLSLRVYDVGRNLSRVPRLVEGQTGNVNKLIPTVDLSAGDFADSGIKDQFYAEVEGLLLVDRPGRYGFELASDDGALLFVGGKLVVDNDGLHDDTSPEFDEVVLEKGAYPLQIKWFDAGGGEALRLRWRPPGSDAFVPVPSDVLRTEAGQVRVTSPGQKEVEDSADINPRRPGDRRPLADVHPAFELVDLRPDGFEPKVGGMDFLPDGRLVLCTWEPDGEVLVLDGVTGDKVDRSGVKVTRLAAGLAEPLGLEVVDGRVFVLQKQELTELVDHDNDGAADEYRAVAGGWPVTSNFHEFAFGLVHKDGRFYAALALAINPGGSTTVPQAEGRGTAIAIDPETGAYETVAAGLRTPNGIGIGVDGEIFINDNQGDWLPSSKMVHLKEGAFYNNHITPNHPLSGRPPTPPVVWLPQGEIGNSPTNPVLVPDGLGPYSGQMLHGDVTHGGVKRVFVEQVDGEYQGAVFRFTQGLEAGVNRIAFGPDGDLYVGGIGSGGNWGQSDKKRFGLQKLNFTGDVPFEMLAVRPGREGVEIEFTKPLADGAGERPGDYRLRRWRYVPTHRYGGPKVDPANLLIDDVVVSPDRRRVLLRTGDLAEDHVIYVLLRDAVVGAGGEQPWSTEAWYTLNRLPNRVPDFAQAAAATENDMPNASATESGFTSLFDGSAESARANWRGFKKSDLPDGWSVEPDGTLHRKSAGGDIVTREQYSDFDLRLEWKVAPGANSGIFYRVAEEGDHTGQTWQTGLEMQVLDDERHADARNGRDRMAGALYDLVDVPDPSPVRPAGEWNETRIVVEDGRILHWVNGTVVADVTLGSADWNRRLAASKFKDMPRFAREARGHIGLQDHGDPVWFRNIRIKSLD